MKGFRSSALTMKGIRQTFERLRKGIDDEFGDYLRKDGTIPLTGNWDAGAYDITIGGDLKVDTIRERTSGSGVTVDGVLLKDGVMESLDPSLAWSYQDHHILKRGDGTGSNVAIASWSSANNAATAIGFRIDDRYAFAVDYNNVYISGANTLRVNNITENTIDYGVMIEGVLLKDGTATFTGTSYLGEEILLTRVDDAYEPAVKLRRARSGDTYPDTNDALGSVQFYGYNEDIGDYSLTAGILARASNDWSASDRSTYMAWYITDGTTTDWDAMKLDQYGDLTLTAGGISAAGDVISDSKNLTSGYDRAELECLFKAAQSTKYTEFTYTGTDLTGVDIWDTSGKATKLFTKVISYSGGDISQITITDEIESSTLIKTFAYSGGNISTITEAIT